MVGQALSKKTQLLESRTFMGLRRPIKICTNPNKANNFGTKIWEGQNIFFCRSHSAEVPLYKFLLRPAVLGQSKAWKNKWNRRHQNSH